MDDDELGSDAQSINGESDDEFHMNSEDDNNSASLNIGEVISLLEYYNMLYVVRAPLYYNMIYLYLVAFLGSKFLR